MTQNKDLGPPWEIFGSNASGVLKSTLVLAAGRPWTVAYVDLVPDHIITEVVKSVNEGRMSVEQAFDLFEFHSKKQDGAI